MIVRHTSAEKAEAGITSEKKSGEEEKQVCVCNVKLELWLWVTVGSSYPGFTTSTSW